ncbi:MAG TPA: protein kinase, partial [Ktedonobacterales bacterium]|nr:protein kinase [Ktedonobacterales bacterium]
VAIKILREVYSSDPKFVTRFQREARAASALQHPNIVQVFDYGQSGDAYYIVMELINGADLRKYLKREGVLTPDRAVEIAHDVALGLGAAHRRTIVHRDVKPQNVLLNDDGLVKLTDFGIASVYKDVDAERLTTTGMTLGTVQYYAPEQAQGEIVTPAADIYALGIVMYEMLTGRTPFDGDTPVAVAMRHIQDIPEPPSRINQMIPRDLERIIMRCLEKDPRDRYPNGDALAYALDQFARGPSRRFGSSSTGRPLDLPGIDARPQPGRGASQFGASAVISGPRRGMQPPDVVANDGYDAPTFEDYDLGMGNGNGLSTTPWATAHGTVPRISGPRGEYDEPRKPRTGLIAAMIGGLVLLLGVACVLVFVLMNGALGGSPTTSTQKTTVPNFVGQQYTAALSLAQSNHLQLQKQTVASDKPVDQVLTQDVASGQKVAYNTPINVTVSGGADTVTVPDVTKMTALDACHALAADTLQLQCYVKSYQQSDSVDNGKVISTDPAAGATAKPGDTVNLIISSGPAPTPTTPVQPTPTPTRTPTPTPTAPATP